ncbi:MAG TPA: type ISP restriction/modification enzyme [Pyrinomonadaceae bacterium]|nr:type ISP restriction/modification enzyme [Pyrinomonadaceae bacterium]
MSKQLLNNYYNKLDETIRFGGSRNETTVEHAFIQLVNSYAERRNLMLVPKIAIKSTKGTNIIPDGALKNALRLDFGYWESKDIKDDIDKEIQAKISKGYPLTNTLFEDSQTAVLFQENAQVMRVSMKDAELLERILHAFVNFEPAQVQEFNKALVKFTEDVPTIVESLRRLIQTEADTNKKFIVKRDEFLANCQTEINPEITLEDVREMMIQHILTADIFTNVFANAEFLRHNNIARELEAVIETFMTYGVRQNYLGSIRSYYDTIRDAAAGIADHHEKQKFLKVVYENFYKVYNPKGADRLGVVYTPNEIVRFMIESTDYLLEKHFNRTLADRNVEILDPATGTGTFVAELIEHIPAQYLAHKFEHEIHANEVAILPYYIAALNIEYTYQQKIGKYKEFKNICFVDTLDNTAALHYQHKQELMFGISSENAARIKKQNERKISVIIGNPPYNANQANFNDFNRNRDYKEIDRRIKDTFVKNSTAQKTKVYDMYARFYRWAMDRIDENGVIAFVTNRSLIDSRTFDGFRKSIEDDFDFAYIVDTRSDVRANPKIAGTTHNVFGIQTGVALMFLVRKAGKGKRSCRIHYVAMDDFWPKEQKLEWFGDNPLSSISFERITPDKKHNWLNSAGNDFETFIPLAEKRVKLGKSDEALFKLYSLGVSTNRDDWVIDFSPETLQKKMRFFIREYDQATKVEEGSSIKWSRNLRRRFLQNQKEKFDKARIKTTFYRPFVKKILYYSDLFIDERGNAPELFLRDNKTILFRYGDRMGFYAIATDNIPNLNIFSLDPAQAVSLYRYGSQGEQHDNITVWGVVQFRNHYGDQKITREDIFHYTYAVLHHPAYRRKYALNLKREFPRLPFYADFRQWAAWGRELMDLHINYESAKPFKLKRVDAQANSTPRTKLKADKTSGVIELDSETVLQGVPPAAWEYKLGNRSALEWILDQYKEKKPSDATIAEKFNTYRFADYKETVVDLLKRVCTVSVKTVEITNQMPKED